MAMLTALSAEAVVHIDEYKKANHADVKCRHCDSPVIGKKGQINAHHFAHVQRLCDPWKTGPMTEWHKCWQDLVRPDFTEVRIEYSKEWHIADIRLTDTTFVEVQHSSLSVKDVLEREQFYGRKMYWILHGKREDVLINTSSGALLRGPKWWNHIKRTAFIDVDGNIFQLMKISCPKENYCVGIPVDREELIQEIFSGCRSDKTYTAPTRVLPATAGVKFSVRNRLDWERPPTGLISRVRQGVLVFEGTTFSYKNVLTCAGFRWLSSGRKWVCTTKDILNWSAHPLARLARDNGPLCIVCGGSVTFQPSQVLLIPSRGVRRQNAQICYVCLGDFQSCGPHSTYAWVLSTDGVPLSGVYRSIPQV